MNAKKEITELIFTILLVVGCHTTKNNFMSLPDFDKEGHRGCRGLMPENTIPAMLTAIDLGVTTLEMDAVITKDKRVILSHEPFFNHEITTRRYGQLVTEQEERSFNIFKMTYAETQRFDVGLKPHPRFPQQKRMAATKPLLENVIDSAEHYAEEKKHPKLFYNIETKSQPHTDNIYHPIPADFVELLVAVIKKKKIEDRVIIQSFDFRTLQYLHAKYPSIKTAALIEGFDKRSLQQQLDQLGFTPTIYSPEHTLVTEELIRKCHEKQMKVIPWTVNDKASMDRLKSLGVDGMISDYPDLF